jgi:hypothetical protein
MYHLQLHGVATQNTNIDIFAAVRTPNLTSYLIFSNSAFGAECIYVFRMILE